MSVPLQPIEQKLRGIRSRLRRLFFIDGMARLLLTVGIFVVVTFLLDYWLVLPPVVRLVMLGLGGLAALWTFWRRVIYPLRVRMSYEDLALLVEQEYPDLHDRLISAIQLSKFQDGPADEQTSPQLIGMLVDEAVEATGPLAFDRILVRKYIAITTGLALLLFLALGGLATYFSEEASVYANRILGRNVRWPQMTFLKVLGFDEITRSRVIAKGDSLDVDVEVVRGRPGALTIEYRFEYAEAGEIDMRKQQDGTYRGTFDRVSGPVAFRIRGGDAETDYYRVETLTPPVVESLRAWYEYPQYTRKPSTPPEAPEVTGNIVAPVYTKVTLEIFSNEELQSGTVVLVTDKKGVEEKVSMNTVSDPAGAAHRWRGDFTLKENHREYQIHVLAKNGLDNHKAMIRYAIKPVIDQPPQIKLLDPISDEDVTEIARRPMSVLTTDEYGVAGIKLVYRVVTQPSAVAEEKKFGANENIPPEYGATSIRSHAELDISKLGVKPGDVIEYHYEATDYKDVEGGNVGKTTPNRFRILSQTELEKLLEGMISEIKKELEAQKKEEEKLLALNRTARQELATAAELNPDQRERLRGAMLRQNSLTQRVDAARKKVLRVLNQGTYNRILNDASIQKLQRVEGILMGISGEENKPGTSELASQFLQTSTKAKNGDQRIKAMADAGKLQDDIVQDLTRALELLDEWSTYQEVVRMVRELYQQQKEQNDNTRKAFGSGENK